ncbi:MAG: hypothetical protein R3E02_10035 [Blastomonas sp.]
MSDYTEFHGEHIRLALLKLLAGQAGYFANDSVLHQAVNAIGLSCTRDQVRGHLGWLAEMRLVTVQHAGSTGQIMVATLTERGGDAAAGRSTVAGVQRPSPTG